ncbi:hypothetical protein K4L44_08530 [Halosquirtibacter laminarini]|uniref:Uncharacterized protein n=1 Tax=Halosquirtibacter laminarini TaxID=3374600 RepID=A0AC61NJH3_9BACT|nr:hypothetical protein K4L44_08530 [Prolixibacteraceae bacterium]
MWTYLTIRDGQRNEIITIHDLSSTESKSYTVPNTVLQYLQDHSLKQRLFVLQEDRGVVKDNKGLFVEGDHEFFVNVRIETNNQGASLTSKGEVGIGKQFFLGFMRNVFSGHKDNNSNFFSIMATEDGTVVRVHNDTFDWFSGSENKKTEWTGDMTSGYQCTLNSGQTVTLGYNIASTSLSLGDDFDSPSGTEVTSSKPVVVNSGSWSASPHSGKARDIGFDQIVPAEVIGDKYIFIKGQGIYGSNTAKGESVILIATEDNTVVEYESNGTTVHHTISKKGDYLRLGSEIYEQHGAITTLLPAIYLTSSKPIYAYQTISGAPDKSQTTGMSFIPPLKCSTGWKVTIPSAKELENPNTSTINAMIKGATRSKFVEINGVPLVDADYVSVGTSGWYTFSYEVTTNDNFLVENSNQDPVNVALYIVSGNIGAAGYFSGFGIRPILNPYIKLEGAVEACADNVDLVIQNPHHGWSYTWYQDDNPIVGETASSFTPSSSGLYYVDAAYGCDGETPKIYQSDKVFLSACLGTSSTLSGVEGTTIDFDVVLSESLSSDLSFDLILEPIVGEGAAIEGNDFQFAESLVHLVIPSGSIKKTIQIDLLDDATHEAPESFTVRIANNSLAKLSIASSVISIVDNDPVVLNLSDGSGATEASYCEGNSRELVLNITDGSPSLSLLCFVNSVERSDILFTAPTTENPYYSAVFPEMSAGTYQVQVKGTDAVPTTFESNVIQYHVKGKPRPLRIMF